MDDLVFKEIEAGKKTAKIGDSHYLFVSVGHPWNECAAYLSDENGEIIEDEPVVFRICADAHDLALEILACL